MSTLNDAGICHSGTESINPAVMPAPSVPMARANETVAVSVPDCARRVRWVWGVKE